jgi:hypothetical protein
MIKSYSKILLCLLLVGSCLQGGPLSKFLSLFRTSNAVHMSPEINRMLNLQEKNAQLKLWLRRAFLVGSASYLYREGILSFNGGKAKETLINVINKATVCYSDLKNMYNNVHDSSKNKNVIAADTELGRKKSV